MDSNKIIMSSTEMKNVLLQILDTFANFCEENNLNYFLDAGTLLGAIRHKGFIPWDDDIDVNMPRKDYDLFCRLVKGKKYISEHCYVKFPEETIYSYMKLLDDRTVLIEFPDKNPIETAVYIDIFPKDTLVKDGLKSKTLCMLSAFTHYWHWFNKYSIIAWKNEKNYLKRLISQVGRKIIKNPDRPVYVQKKIIAWHNNKCLNMKCKYVTTLVNGEYKKRAPKECFDKYIMGEFEGRKYRIPCEYDIYLRCLYSGNYMELPPENERYHHNTLVYWRSLKDKKRIYGGVKNELCINFCWWCR